MGKLEGEGADGELGGPKGNLFVQVIVEEDEYFTRDGANVHTEIPISMGTAILGGSIDVKTLTGMVEMKIPKGCQPETKLLLKHKGIQKLGSTSKGNHIVHVKIEVPTQITKRQEELIREFDKVQQKKQQGIKGKITSAFETIFGSNKNNDADDDDDDENDKENKQQAV